MKQAIWILVVLMLSSVVYAETQTINMRTIDYFITEFTVNNVNNIDYRNCVPYLDDMSDNHLKDYMTFTPQIFNMGKGGSQTISGKLENVPAGYYTAEINVRCDKFSDGKLAETGNILNTGGAPNYEIFITHAGEGQDYVFVPGQSYNFVSKPGQTETASFSIANTGNTPLAVDITPQAAYMNIISVNPRQITVPAMDRTQFKITVLVPQNFTGFSTNLTIKVGDYTENFPVVGEVETIGVGGGAVAQNLFTGSISAGDLKIPVWAVVIVILVAGFFLFKSEFKPKKKRSRR